MSDDGTTQIYLLAIWPAPGDYSHLRVKIGRSANAMKRIAQHMKPKNGRAPECYRILGVIRGCEAHEKALHRHFDDLRWDTGDGKREQEVFRPEPRLADYIRWLRDQYYVWLPAEDDPYFRPLSEMESVPYSEWCPNEQRIKPPPSFGLLPPPDGPLNLPPREITADDYYTGEVIIKAARVALGGHIDLDPASHAAANRVVRAERFFTKSDNGLAQEWAGNVWLNPPFSAWEAWSAKALHEWQSGRVENLCALAANRTTSARYFAPFLAAADACCQTEGRIPFGGIGGASPDDGHTIYYFGPNRERFRRAFSDIGKVWYTPAPGGAV